MASAPEKLSIKTADGESFELAKDLYQQSDYLKEQVSVAEGEVELFDLDKAQFEKIVEFLTKNQENPIPVADIEQDDPFAEEGKTVKIPKPLASSNLTEAGFPAWAAEWVNGFSQDELFEYAPFADSLGIHSLVLLMCAKIASIIKAMDVAAYNETFKLEKEYTPEEEAAIRASNKWAES